ncbi:hypothetical protein ACFL1V_05030 [Pseudomonadota bacterium]
MKTYRLLRAWQTIEVQISSLNGLVFVGDQISLVFGIEIDKDVVRCVLAKHYRPKPESNGPSWLTFLGRSKDSLWSVDLFRCESLILKSHWVMVVMDQLTRRIVGFAIHAGEPDHVNIESLKMIMVNHRIVNTS